MGRAHRTPRDQRRRTHQQNFLTDAALARRLVADVGPDDLVVDLGAGAGALTLPAAAAGARVLAVELDPAWCATLRGRVGEAGLGSCVRVVEGDLREVALPVGDWRVISSPPYALTTALLRRLLDDPRRGPSRADLVVQFEVARKFAADPPTTLLGSAWAPWWETTLVERIPRTSFRPVPGVDSAWLRIRRRHPDILTPELAPAWKAFLADAWPPALRSPATAGRTRPSRHRKRS